MFHAGIEMSREGVLYQQGGEVQGPEDELLCPLGLDLRLVTSEYPGAGLSGSGRLQDLIADIEDVDPVIQLTFTCRHQLEGHLFLILLHTIGPCFNTFQFL